jgi:hypothetical protein
MGTLALSYTSLLLISDAETAEPWTIYSYLATLIILNLERIDVAEKHWNTWTMKDLLLLSNAEQLHLERKHT